MALTLDEATRLADPSGTLMGVFDGNFVFRSENPRHFDPDLVLVRSDKTVLRLPHLSLVQVVPGFREWSRSLREKKQTAV